MIPYKEFRPFILGLIWKGIKELGEITLGFLALVWIAGWLIIAPVQFVIMYMTDDIPLMALIPLEAFWLVPTAFFIWSYLSEAWENHLIKKGYTKS